MGFLIIASLLFSALAVLVMVLVVFRHWKEIRLLDPQSIKEVREGQKRDELLLQRIDRLAKEKIAPVHRAALKMGELGARAAEKLQERMRHLEQFYAQAKTPFSGTTSSQTERINMLVHEGRAFIRDLKWADAERKFIEVLGIDARNKEAFNGLGLIYLKQKMFTQARETFEFLVRSKQADDVAFASLAEIEELEGHLGRAEEMRRKAVESRPRLPNRQAELAELYLKLQLPAKAWPHAKRAADLDPKSSRYLEVSLDTAILLGNRNEAKRRYDRLRLLSEDPSTLQGYKDRIDALPLA